MFSSWRWLSVLSVCHHRVTIPNPRPASHRVLGTSLLPGSLPHMTLVDLVWFYAALSFTVPLVGPSGYQAWQRGCHLTISHHKKHLTINF